MFSNFYFKIRFKIYKYKINKKIKTKEKGYDSFVKGMVALANKDFKTAIQESRKTLDHAGDNPSLYLLLRSESLKVEKKYEELREIYKKMIENNYTKNLGLKGMMEQYLLSQDYHHAFIYAEKLFNNNPHIEKIYETLLNIIIKTSNWHQLIIITERAFEKKIIKRKEYEENKSIAFYEIAKVKKLSNTKEAISFINKALKLKNNFAPYVRAYLDLLIENNQLEDAKKYVRKIWKIAPHPEYKDIIYNLSNIMRIDLLDLIKYITESYLKSEESKLLLIEALIFKKKWNDARNEIKFFLEIRPKKNICLLMAKIEEGENNDIQKKNSWLLRSNNGQHENMWVCMISKKDQNFWSSVSQSGYFNSLEWREPYMLNEINIQNTNQISYEN